jgi:predicted O-methyltransferase YrrM
MAEQSPVEYRTEQERFWAGKFGSDYIERNRSEAITASNLAFFSRALRRARRIDSCLEFGANIGLNLRAIRQLLPGASLSAIEINPDAAKLLRQWFDSSGGGDL